MKARRNQKKSRKIYRKKAIATKRTAYGNSSRNVPKTLVNVGLGFPKKMLVKQKYVENLVLNSSVGLPNVFQFVMNGLFDPYFTGGGHQPMYFDQYMAIYNHYTTIGCKLTVKFMPDSANTVPMYIALFQNDDTTVTPVSLFAMAEQSGSKAKLIGSGAGLSPQTLTLSWSAKKTFGGSVLSNPQLRGNAAANPVEQSIAAVAIQSADAVTTTKCYMQIYIEFLSIYSELKDLGPS